MTKQTKQQKVELVETLSVAFKDAASAVFVGFKGLNVADETAMRRELRAAGVTYMVAKKTLIRRALETLGLAGKDAAMPGEIAVAYGGGDDSTVAARLVHEFGKKFVGKVAILGGVFEGKLADQKLMQEIATIPSLDALRGMFANVVNSPLQRFAIALSEVAKTKGN